MTHIKLRFPFGSPGDEAETETMWTKPQDGGYEIDNIPFYVKELALGDIVEAEADTDGSLWYSKLLRASGHSTIRLWFASAQDVHRVRDELRLGFRQFLSYEDDVASKPAEYPWTVSRPLLACGRHGLRCHTQRRGHVGCWRARDSGGGPGHLEGRECRDRRK